MGKTIKNEYRPTEVSPPGATLGDILEERNMTQAELAERMGRTQKFVSNVTNGKAPITQETALQLERVMDVPAHFWNRREQQYREALARQKERNQLENYVSWMWKHIPVRDMIEREWVKGFEDEVDQVREVLDFFDVNSPKEWKSIWLNTETRAAFRKSLTFASEPGPVAAWLQYGEVMAREIECAPFNKQKFREILHEIRALTVEDPQVFGREMHEHCRNAGVALVFTPQVNAARISGATRWVSSDKALIQMSLRHRSDDHFWFTFFHEAGHVLLHGKRDVFLEESEEELPPEKEEEANNFAANLLVPSHVYEDFIAEGDFSFAAVRSFAHEIGITPAIVVGRLQHDRHIPWNSRLNSLKRSLRWEYERAEEN